MLERIDEGICCVDSGRPGPAVCISYGVHGNETPPVDAGRTLRERFEAGELALRSGKLLLVHANPLACSQNERWSAGGIDLNRCFHPTVLARAPELYEERRARRIADALEEHGIEILVDFHCTVEPGRRFLMQHPSVEHEPSREVCDLLAAEVLLTDPTLTFGGVSLDEHMTTRGLVGICYETGWINDPANTPASVLGEMLNVLAGLGMIQDVQARSHDAKTLLEMDGVLLCEGEGFRWQPGVGENLQSLAKGTLLGRYGDGRELVLDRPATLIFPQKKPELVQQGKPLVYLASAKAS